MARLNLATKFQQHQQFGFPEYSSYWKGRINAGFQLPVFIIRSRCHRNVQWSSVSFALLIFSMSPILFSIIMNSWLFVNSNSNYSHSYDIRTTQYLASEDPFKPAPGSFCYEPTSVCWLPCFLTQHFVLFLLQTQD